MAARLSSTSLTLEPRDESREGESGRQSTSRITVTSTRRRSRGRSRRRDRSLRTSSSRGGSRGRLDLDNSRRRRNDRGSRVARLRSSRHSGCGATRAAARCNLAARSLVRGDLEAVVVVGDEDVLVLGIVCARQLDGRSAGSAARAADLELGAANVELGAAGGLGRVQGKHFGAELKSLLVN
jgi:hypothetical protein